MSKSGKIFDYKNKPKNRSCKDKKILRINIKSAIRSMSGAMLQDLAHKGVKDAEDEIHRRASKTQKA